MHRSEVGLFLSSNPHREIIVLTKKKCGSHGGGALEGAAWVLASMLDMPSRRRNHVATQENPHALQGPSAARLDPDAAVVPRVQPVCHRPVQTSLDQIERESRLSSHTLVDPPRSIDRGGHAGRVGGGDARRRMVRRDGPWQEVAAGWRWDREADMAMAEEDRLAVFFSFSLARTGLCL